MQTATMSETGGLPTYVSIQKYQTTSVPVNGEKCQIGNMTNPQLEEQRVPTIGIVCFNINGVTMINGRQYDNQWR